MSAPPPGTPRLLAGPSHSLNRQIVLEEDEYTAALSHIIARDFFPSLTHLDAANEYLDAVDSSDHARVQASVNRLAALQQTPLVTPGRAPYATPRAAGDSDEPPAKRQRLNADLSLDDFQARYTSEDNSSFTQILDQENWQRRSTHKWAWDAEERANTLRTKQIANTERLRIEAPKPLLITASGEGKSAQKMVETDEEKALIVLPDPDAAEEDKEQPVDVMAKKKDKRTPLVDAWAFKARNSLMFPPDADVSPYNAPTAPLEEKSGPPKEIKHSNTRMPEQNEETVNPSEPPSPTRSRVAAAIAGVPYIPSAPQVRGYALVDAVPTINPTDLSSDQQKQLMTWGTLDATPRVISDDPDAPPQPLAAPRSAFHIKPRSAREELGLRLSNTAAKSLRAKAAIMNGTPSTSRTPFGLASGRTPDGRMSMPPPTTPRDASAGMLTPAAKRLLQRTAGARRADAMNQSAGWTSTGGLAAAKRERDMARVRWTPSPAVNRR
ncbi:nuclear protein DGCR14 [Auriculariales sp. MPI-PUGE-AT-0066]|nr:nuclear protein DGCR14 [Auriculariales sp. MPI-PUGE-AT-0066]